MISIGGVATGVNVLGGLLGPFTRASQQDEASQPAAGAPVKPPKPQADPPPGATAALRNILARYDVTAITPRQFSAMLDELRTSGALGDQELGRLGQVLSDLNADGVDMDEETDLVKFYGHKLEKLQDQLDEADGDQGASSAVATSLAAIQGRLNWLTKFSLMHAAPDAVGMDLLT